MKLPRKRHSDLPVSSDLGVPGVGPFVHPVDPSLAPRPAWQAARDAVNKAIAEMDQKGALDAGNGDVLDAWLDQLAPQWHAHDVMAAADAEATAQLAAGEYEALATYRRERADAARAERDRVQRLLEIHERELLAPHDEPVMSRPDRRRRPRPALDSLEGLTHQPWWRLVSILMLLLAAAGDLISFWITLQQLLWNAPGWMVLPLTAAVTAAAVGLMHIAGRTARNLREGQGGLGRVALAVTTVSWLLLGATAFYVRTQVRPPGNSDLGFGQSASSSATASTALMSALLLGALFVGSGILAYWIGFSDHRPRMAAFWALRKELGKRQHELAQEELKANEAEARLATAKQEIERTRRRSDAARDSVDAEIAELKELARLHIAGLIGQPSATNNLTTGRSDGGGAMALNIPMARDAGTADGEGIAQKLGVPTPARNGNGHSAH